MVMLGHAWVYGVGDEGNLEVELVLHVTKVRPSSPSPSFVVEGSQIITKRRF